MRHVQWIISALISKRPTRLSFSFDDSLNIKLLCSTFCFIELDVALDVIIAKCKVGKLTESGPLQCIINTDMESLLDVKGVIDDVLL